MCLLSSGHYMLFHLFISIGQVRKIKRPHLKLHVCLLLFFSCLENVPAHSRQSINTARYLSALEFTSLNSQSWTFKSWALVTFSRRSMCVRAVYLL